MKKIFLNLIRQISFHWSSSAVVAMEALTSNDYYIQWVLKSMQRFELSSFTSIVASGFNMLTRNIFQRGSSLYALVFFNILQWILICFIYQIGKQLNETYRSIINVLTILNLRNSFQCLIQLQVFIIYVLF